MFFRSLITCFTTALLSIGMLSATSYSIEITNLTSNITFTPFLVTAHPSSANLFKVGGNATANLEAMAEGGDISGLLADVGGADIDTIENPASGTLSPGARTTATIDNQSGNDYLSIVSMLLPTNDAFVGLDSYPLPSSNVTIYLNAYDAGTEANDELITSIPADPSGSAGTGGTGVTTSDSNNTVHIHPGVLGDTNSTGGVSDLDSTIHRWLNPVAKVKITLN